MSHEIIYFLYLMYANKKKLQIFSTKKFKSA